MSKELDRLINHCETQIRLATEFGDKQHKKEHEDILKIINEYKQIKLDFELYKDNHSYANYEVEKLEGSLKTYEILLKSNDISRLTQEIDLYKSVLNEARELCELMLRIFEQMNEQQRVENLDKFKPYDKVCQILDKVGDK